MADKLVSVNDDFDFPAPVAARQAARLGDATTAEGKALKAAATIAAAPKLDKTEAANLYASKSDLDSFAGALAGTFNITPETTRTLRKQLAQVRAGVGSARMLFIGDSTTWGVGSTGGTNIGYRASRTSIPARFTELVNSYYAPARLTMAVPPSKNDGATSDIRWNAGAGWVLAYAGFGQMSAYQAPAGVTTPLTYTPDGTANIDTFDIYWVRNTTLGAFTASVNEGAPTTVNTAGAGAVQKTTITATASAENILTIIPSGGVYIVGVDAYLSTSPVIRVANAGVASARAADWATTSGGGSLWAIQAYAPDLAIIMLGINDSKGPRTKAQFKADLTAIVQRCKLTGDVILMSVIPSKFTGTLGSPDYVFQQQYREATKELAMEMSCGYVDIYGRFESFPIADAAGYMKPDGIHTTDFGQVDVASALFAGVRTL